MKALGHRTMTAEAFLLVRALVGNHPLLGTEFKDQVVAATPATDDMTDLEFVDVESTGLRGGTGRDDPHADDRWVTALSEDQARYKPWGYNTTSFNHFIDVRKGGGRFDDYDGYSYHHGSARLQQYQTVHDYIQHDAPLEKHGLPGLVGAVLLQTGKPTWKVDEALNWWFSDEYVHARPHQWYRGCSPAVERYSYPADTGRFPGILEELKSRFPLAEYKGGANKGIPYSVFLPVDNLARYWYNDFIRSRAPAALGAVFHAIGDASIPHHAAGCSGNWHSRYERSVDMYAEKWGQMTSTALWMLKNTDKTVSPPPKPLTLDNVRTAPFGNNWPIQDLVTRVALLSYLQYRDVYGNFSSGYRFNGHGALSMWIQGVVTCAHVLRLIVRNYPPKMVTLSGLQSMSGFLRVPAAAGVEVSVNGVAADAGALLLRGETLKDIEIDDLLQPMAPTSG
jgi:hypothetical protein